MQYKNSDVIRCDARHELVKNTPSWLRVRGPETLPIIWLHAARVFVSLTESVLGRYAPLGAIVRMREWEGHLKIDLVLSASHQETDAIFDLRRVAEHYEELSALLLKSIKTSGPTRCVITKHAASKAAVDALPAVGERDVTVFRWAVSHAQHGGSDIGRDEDSSKRIRKTLARLAETGFTRPLCMPPSDWQEQLESLVQTFPNLATFIKTVVRPHIGIVAMGRDHRMPPVLLVGPPGISKTYFANALARVLGVSVPLVVQMATESTGSIAGSSTLWVNSSPGQLFESLAWSKSLSRPCANGLMVIDEIDKVGKFRNFQFDPLGALYSLLEVETARSFQDLSLPDIFIDASRVRILATANDIAEIPEPILSRMLVVQVGQPSSAQLRKIILGIYQGLVKKLGCEFMREMPADVVDAALHLSPREAKVRLECAIASAVVDGRESIQESDWPIFASAAEQGIRRKIGFML